jgi:choline kinase
MIGKNKELDQKDYLDLDKSARQYTTSVSRKRLSGRPSVERLASYKPTPSEGNPSLSSLLSDSSADAGSHSHHAHENLLKQVGTWIKHERNRRHARRAKRKAAKDGTPDHEPAKDTIDKGSEQAGGRARSSSESSHDEDSLDQLAHILEKTLSMKPAEAKKRSNHLRRLSTGLKRHSAISSRIISSL